MDKDSLSKYRIESVAGAMYYIADFITSEEELHILSSLPSNRWITLSHRRLQAHPSPLTDSNVLLASALPKCLTEPIQSRFQRLGLFDESPHGAPNHVLVNEYKPGEGIMPHEDGAAYFPLVATVSLGASIVLDVHEKRGPDSKDVCSAAVDVHGGKASTPRWRVLQEPRSLLVTTASAYTDLLHGIADVEVDGDLTPDTVANWSLLGDGQTFVESGSRNVRGTRTSLTYRDVLKVSKVGSRIFGKPRH